VTTLQPFDAAFRGELRWRQPARLRSRWELTADGTVVATLAAAGPLAFAALARFRQGTWRFRPRFPGRVDVFEAGAEVARARFRPGWFMGGRLERAAEEVPLRWARENLWGNRWVFRTEELHPFLHVRVHWGFLRHEATIELEDAARRAADLPVLVALGWYLALRAARHNSG
jgi:hypothetical protein